VAASAAITGLKMIVSWSSDYFWRQIDIKVPAGATVVFDEEQGNVYEAQ